MRTVYTKNRKINMSGGSVLLSKGGPGDASSYESPEEYNSITGRGLWLGLYAGSGLDNLKQLKTKSLSVKPRNIKF